MTEDLFGPNGFAAVFAFIAWSLAALGMGRLTAARRMGKLRRHAVALLVLIGTATLLSAAKIAIGWALWPSGWWPPRNGMVLQIPLLVVPAALVLAFTVPGLWRLARGRQGNPDERVDAAARSRVAEPRFVVPVQAAMWGRGRSCISSASPRCLSVRRIWPFPSCWPRPSWRFWRSGNMGGGRKRAGATKSSRAG